MSREAELSPEGIKLLKPLVGTRLGVKTEGRSKQLTNPPTRPTMDEAPKSFESMEAGKGGTFPSKCPITCHCLLTAS